MTGASFKVPKLVFIDEHYAKTLSRARSFHDLAEQLHALGCAFHARQQDIGDIVLRDACSFVIRIDF